MQSAVAHADQLVLWWPVVLSVASLIASWGMDHSDKKHLERRICSIENVQQQQSLSNLAIAGALKQIEAMDERQGRIEDKVDGITNLLLTRAGNK